MSYELSVIIPVYNVEKYIEECLDSVVNQSLGIDNIEVIIVNDATPDNSMDKIKKYLEKYPSFKVVTNKTNKGLGESRNIGLKYVTSDYVTFLDSDDFISKNAYKDSISQIKESDSDLLIYNWESYTGSDYVGPASIHQQNTLENRVVDDIKKSPELIFSTASWNKIYHKSLFKYLNYSKGLYEDNLVTISTLINAKRIFLSKDAIYYHRKNLESITENINKNNVFDLCNSINDLFKLNDEIIIPLIIKFINDVLFWIYYYDWDVISEIEFVEKLKNSTKTITKAQMGYYKELFPDGLLYCEDILNLHSYDSKTFLAKYKYFNRLNKVNSQASLYVDVGCGFSEENKVAINYSPLKSNNLEFNLEEFDNISSLRFDPLEGSFIKCGITNNLPIAASNCDNSVEDDYQIFTNLDPYYVLDADFSNISSFQINFDLEILTNDDIANLFRQKDNIINDLQVKPKKRKFNFFK